MTEDPRISNPSPLEIMILRGTHYNNRFIANLFDYFLPDDILVFSTTNHLIHSIVGGYSDLVWDLERTLGHWFPHVETVRLKMVECRALIGGEVPLNFFDRRGRMGKELHIFLPVGGLLRMGEHLMTYGYNANRKGVGINFFSAAFAVSMHSMASAFSVAPTLCDPPLAEFTFVRRSRKGKVVVLYVVRPDPIYFVLSLPNSEYSISSE